MSTNVRTCRDRRSRRRPRGFGAIAALVVLVLMAALAAAVVRIGVSQQGSLAQGLSASRATAAAAAGLEWGAWQVLKGSWGSCNAASQTLDLSADTGLWVTVACQATAYNEGESAPGTARTVTSYTLTATACNSSAGCPDNARVVELGYVERSTQSVIVN